MVSVTAPYGELMCKRLFNSADLVCKVAHGNKVPKEDMKRRLGQTIAGKSFYNRWRDPSWIARAWIDLPWLLNGEDSGDVANFAKI